MRRTKRWIALILIPLAVLVTGLSYREWCSFRLNQNEREASAALKGLPRAEADFRANDRDWNHVNDFWTGDVAGLFYVRPNSGENSPEIALIPRAVAEADAKPLKALTSSPVPYHGYYFVALDLDATLKGTGEESYRVDTLGEPRMGKVHNTSKFGFCAYPAEYGVTGRKTFIINENNTLFGIDLGGKPMTEWPDDSPPRKSEWEGHYQKLD